MMPLQLRFHESLRLEGHEECKKYRNFFRWLYEVVHDSFWKAQQINALGLTRKGVLSSLSVYMFRGLF